MTVFSELNVRSIKSPALMPLLRRAARFVAYLAVTLAVWFAYVRLKDVPSFLLPSPETVGSALIAMHQSGQLWGNLFYTLNHIFLGFFSGIVIGISIGYATWRWPILQRIASPYIVFLQAAPKIAIAPLLVLWFGLGPASQLSLIFILTFFPMMVAMQLGIRSIPPELRTLGDLLGMGRWRYFWVVQFPGSLPDLLSGAKVAIIDAMTGAFLAEYISSQKGLGFLMVLGNQSFNTPMLVAAIIITVTVGLLGFAAVSAFEKRLLRWRPAAERATNKGEGIQNATK